MSTMVLENKYNMLSSELQQSLDLYLDFLLEKMSGQKNEAKSRKSLDFSIYNTRSNNWPDPQTFIAELRNEERF